MNFLKMFLIFTFVSTLPYCESSFSNSKENGFYDKDTIQVKQKSGSVQTYVIVNPPGAGTIYSNKITILVPGIGGNASYWANDGVDSVYHLSEWSLPYVLSNQFGGEVFVYGKGSSTFGFYRSVDWEESEYQLAHVNSGIYPVDKNVITRSIHQQVVIFCPTAAMSIDTISRHVPISDGGPRFVNDEVFTAMMDILINSNAALKFNLIGHSRGGLLNMKIASMQQYFRKINHLISLGTPYYFNGLALATGVLDALAQTCPTLDSFLDSIDGHYIDAYADLLLDNELLSIRNNWNTAIQDTYHTTHAIAYGFSMVFSLTSPLQGLSWNERNNGTSELRIFDQYGPTFDSDLLVGTKSQLGLGSSDFLTNEGNLIDCDLSSGIDENDSSYLHGFERKLFFYDPLRILGLNASPKRSSVPNQLGIPHNLEPMTPIVVQRICQDLV